MIVFDFEKSVVPEISESYASRYLPLGVPENLVFQKIPEDLQT